MLALTASDLMSRDVVLLPQEMSVRAAARMLADAHISGAPVLDQNGCCIGVFSTSDVVRWAADKDRSRALRHGVRLLRLADGRVGTTSRR